MKIIRLEPASGQGYSVHLRMPMKHDQTTRKNIPAASEGDMRTDAARR
jgi:hypothetical protein